ncbi:MAG: divalent cation tolerance protein CutA [bacterium]|nr:divalent cation tolerance protein CutA [bacterium]
MKKIIWIIINCTNAKEAKKIGDALLHERSIACYDIIPERQAAYFWPPNTGKIERVKGSMLIGVTLPEKYKAVLPTARKLHKDEVPFIGSITIDNTNPDYYDWLKKEINQRSS